MTKKKILTKSPKKKIIKKKAVLEKKAKIPKRNKKSVSSSNPLELIYKENENQLIDRLLKNTKKNTNALISLIDEKSI